MPCYLRGTIRLTNFERLQQEANKLGLQLTKEDEIITLSKDGVKILSANEAGIVAGSGFFKETIRAYNIQQVKIAAMKKGWKFEMVKVEDGKIKMRISE